MKLLEADTKTRNNCSKQIISKKLLSILIILFCTTSVFANNKDTPHIEYVKLFKQLLFYTTLIQDGYRDPHALKDKYKTFKKNFIYTVTPKTEVLFFILKKKQEDKTIQYLVIRGTSNLANAIVDLKFKQVKDSKTGLYVHEGFLAATRQIYSKAKKYLSKKKPLIIVGHSMGGALAALVGIYFNQSDYSVKKIITFGQPKVAGKLPGDTLSKLPILRIILKDDLFQYIPFVDLKGRLYYHFGKALHLQDGKDFYTSEADNSFLFYSITMIKAVTEIRKRIKDKQYTENIMIHYIDKYIANIKEKIKLYKSESLKR